MTPRKHSLYVSIPSYAGNGGTESVHPDIMHWWGELTVKLSKDERISEVTLDTKSDTPIPMIRNHAVVKARNAGADLLLFVDSDQSPNKHRGESWWKPFWDVAFEAIYKHWEKGPLCIGAPYVGGPGPEGQNVYVFAWESQGDPGDEASFKMIMYPRQIANKLSGLQECAALPTGMMLIDMRCFELIEPATRSKREVLELFQQGKLDIDQAMRGITEGWFYYEWKNGYATHKASTEDVTFTRDLSMAGMRKLGYNPLRCAWDCWVGHHKPWNAGKPVQHGVDEVGNVFWRAMESGLETDERIINFQASPKTINLLEAQNERIVRMNGAGVEA